MRRGFVAAATALLFAQALASTAVAGVHPYVRVGFGGNTLAMTDVDTQILSDQGWLNHGAWPASFHKVGNGMGPNMALGAWLTPNFRLGLTGRYNGAFRENYYYGGHVKTELDGTTTPVDSIFFDKQMNFRMWELGGEAVYRFPKLQGFMIGGQVSEAWGKYSQHNDSEYFTAWDKTAQVFTSATTDFGYEEGRRSRPTGEIFVGFDQTNPNGVAGFVKVGYAFRNMDKMPSTGWDSFDGTTVLYTAKSFTMDFSGVFVHAGIGFDAPH